MIIRSNVWFALNWVNASLTSLSLRLVLDLLQRNADLVAFDPHIELFDFGDGVDGRNAARQAEGPAVPGALHRQVVAIDVAFANRPAAMRTDVVKRVVFAVDVEQGDGAALDFYDHPLTRGYIRSVRH